MRNYIFIIRDIPNCNLKEDRVNWKNLYHHLPFNSAPPKNMKILHFNVYKHLLPGIKHQLIDERRAASELSTLIEWTTVAYSLDTPTQPFMKQASVISNKYIPKRLNEYLSLKTQAYDWLLENQHHFDVILLRYSAGDPFLFFNVNKINNFISIHHTLEHHESLLAGGIVGYLHSKLEQISAPYILNKSVGLVGVTDEIRQYEVDRIQYIKPSYTCPNGITITHPAKLIDQRTDEVKIVFIASTFSSWHGLDIVLEQFRQSALPVKLEVIGDVPNTLRVNDSRITYHGTLNKLEITDILNSVDIGLSCFALGRKGMKEACTLKVREYLENGIPVYANHVDSALPKNFPYYINRQFSLEYVVKLTSEFKKTSRSQVRNASEEFIDKKAQLKMLVEWITTINTLKQK